MKRLFLAAILAMSGGGALYAGVIIDCSGDKAQVNSCMAGKLPSFTTQLDWAAMHQPADGSLHDGVWTVSLPDGINVSAHGTGLTTVDGKPEGMLFGYNFGSIWDGTRWVMDAPGMPYGFAGRFDSKTTPPPGGGPETDPGECLLGLWLNGVSPNRQLVLDFDKGIYGVGFRASSSYETNFNLRVQVFAETGGAPMLDKTLTYTGVGGECKSLLTMNAAPTACNDAPFIAALGLAGQAKKLVLSTDDRSGFYMGTLYVSSSVPEPGAVILCGCGLVLLAIGSRRWRHTS